ncbi:MAG: Hsp20/alpha crystallin family protein [Lachnospiraceae bacterium]|nr:Hsp20/alpha crystallin family protein [Lachnospiraceae bacterium]
MMTPSLFNDNFDLFDLFRKDPWFDFDNHEFKNLEKKLYGHNYKNVMSTDIKESDSGYEMTVDLPGFKKDEVSVALENGYLTISAAKGLEKDEASDEEEKQKGNYIRRERYCGSCQRSFYVGDNLKVEDIKANFQHGILNLNIPKKEQEKVANNKYIAIEG